MSLRFGEEDRGDMEYVRDRLGLRTSTMAWVQSVRILAKILRAMEHGGSIVSVGEDGTEERIVII